MEDRRAIWLLLPKPVRQLPADLVAMLILTALVNVSVFVPVVQETPLRVLFGLVFVLFVPGYVFIAALFPEAGNSPTTEDPDENEGYLNTGQRSGIDGIERVALGFGLSIALVPLIGLILNFTPWGIRLVPIMVAITGFTLIMTVVAAVRRVEIPEDERFRVPYKTWYRTGRNEVFDPQSRADGALNVLLALSIVLAVGTVTFAIVVPPEGEQFSAIYLLTEDDDDELVAAGYPTAFEQGESSELIVGIDNNEHRTVNYTVVALEQRVAFIGNDSVVTEQRELDRFETTIAHNESIHHTYTLEPTMVGDEIRVVWLLFPDGEVPEDPSRDDVESDVHLWVSVSADS